MNKRLLGIILAVVLVGALGAWAFAGKSDKTATPQPTVAAQSTAAPDKFPLGDNKYVTDSPKQGYIYLCRVNQGGGGAAVDGPWIKGDYWYPAEKVAVQGNVSWPNAVANFGTSGKTRTITTNDLPKGQTTGVFPVAQDDPAYQYDRNPNQIQEQTVSYTLNAEPQEAAKPSCLGGMVGIMTNGVLLFNGFDALHRDAQAHEVQDHCDGHPQVTGQYHYHGLSSCFKDARTDQVLGYAFDGFPITGPNRPDGTVAYTADLDACHGEVGEVEVDGQKVKTYHYVLTADFPYSASCFKGTPISQDEQQSGSGNQGEAGAGGPPQ